MSLFSVCACEQGKRLPEEMPSDFGIADANTAFRYLLELAHLFGLRPVRSADVVVLAHAGCKKPLNKPFRDWHFAWVELQENDDEAAYQNWKDEYKGE